MAPSNWRREKIEMEFFGATITEFAALTADRRLRHAQTLKLTCQGSAANDRLWSQADEMRAMKLEAPR